MYKETHRIKKELGDIWWVNYPLEENDTETKKRPAIVIREEQHGYEVLVVKVTSELRHLGNDKYKVDFLIEKWSEANLTKESLARVSKFARVNECFFEGYIGRLAEEDLNTLKVNLIFLLEQQKKEKSK